MKMKSVDITRGDALLAVMTAVLYASSGRPVDVSIQDCMELANRILTLVTEVEWEDGG